MTIAQSAAHVSARTFSLRPIGFILSLFLWIVVHSQSFARPYTVKSGDSLQRIAQRELGTANRWQEIARQNNLPPPHTIRLGQQLTLPDAQTSGIPLAPPHSPANLTPPPAPVLPPGNALPLDPYDTSSLPVSHDLPSPESFGSLWWIIPFSVLGGLVFYALTLRISCWFSLVDVTFLLCFKLSLYSLLLAVACFIGCALVWLIAAALGLATNSWSMEVTLAVAPFTLIAWFFLSIIVIKRTLDCKWRSVITILVMASFAAQLLALVLAVSTGTVAAMLMK